MDFLGWRGRAGLARGALADLESAVQGCLEFGQAFCSGLYSNFSTWYDVQCVSKERCRCIAFFHIPNIFKTLFSFTQRTRERGLSACVCPPVAGVLAIDRVPSPA